MAQFLPAVAWEVVVQWLAHLVGVVWAWRTHVCWYQLAGQLLVDGGVTVLGAVQWRSLFSRRSHDVVATWSHLSRHRTVVQLCSNTDTLRWLWPYLDLQFVKRVPMIELAAVRGVRAPAKDLVIASEAVGDAKRSFGGVKS